MNATSSKAVRRAALLKLVLVLVLGIGAGMALFIGTLRAPDRTAEHTLAAVSSDDLQGLLDQRGRSFDSARLQGRYALLYFGFSFCPDACPTALYNLTLALQQLDPEAMRIQPVFVSVDPVRDTPAQLKEYLSHFSERIIGLTGPLDSIQLAEQAFGVIAVEHRDATLPGGYTMDHSNEFLLLSPTGKLLTRLPADLSAAALLQQLRSLATAQTV